MVGLQHLTSVQKQLRPHLAVTSPPRLHLLPHIRTTTPLFIRKNSPRPSPAGARRGWQRLARFERSGEQGHRQTSLALNEEHHPPFILSQEHIHSSRRNPLRSRLQSLTPVSAPNCKALAGRYNGPVATGSVCSRANFPRPPAPSPTKATASSTLMPPRTELRPRLPAPQPSGYRARSRRVPKAPAHRLLRGKSQSNVFSTALWAERGATDELIAVLRSANSTPLTADNTIQKALFV